MLNQQDCERWDSEDEMKLGELTKGYSGKGQVSQQLDRIDVQIKKLFETDAKLFTCLEPVMSHAETVEEASKTSDENEPLVPLADRLNGIGLSLQSLQASLDRYVSDCEL